MSERISPQIHPRSYTDLEIAEGDRRAVPVRVYEPVNPEGLILFSTGFGGNRDGYRYLASAWRDLGFAVVVIQHPGSDLEALKALPARNKAQRDRAVVERVQNGKEHEERGRDLLSVADRFRRLYPSLPIGLAGHSFGASTVALGLGLRTSRGFALEPIPGVVGVQFYSPSPPDTMFPASEFLRVGVESTVLTGVNDGLLGGLGDFRERAKLFRSLPRTAALLAVHSRADHMAFAGLGLDIRPTLEEIAALSGRWWSQLWDTGEARTAVYQEFSMNGSWRMEL